MYRDEMDVYMYIFTGSVQTDVRTVRRTEMLKRERRKGVARKSWVQRFYSRFPWQTVKSIFFS